VFAIISPSALIESRRGPGHYAGGSQGFSFRIAKGVRYRVGANRGTYVQGDEKLTQVDTGSVTVTSMRIVFQGSKQSREWALAKVLGIQHDPDMALTMISVSNRQKVSGFTYDETHTATVRLRVSMAVATATGRTDELVSDLEAQLAELDSNRPQPPAPPPAPNRPAAPPAESTPAAWYPDPANPTTLRWWDGTRWTDDVHAG
jgi:hypothetical protein